jgi:hypothetical protein
MPGARRIIPADPCIPRAHPPRRTRKLQATDHRWRGLRDRYQILNMRERNGIPNTVIAVDQFPKQLPLLATPNLVEHHWRKSLYPSLERRPPILIRIA